MVLYNRLYLHLYCRIILKCTSISKTPKQHGQADVPLLSGRNINISGPYILHFYICHQSGSLLAKEGKKLKFLQAEFFVFS